jgi:cytochrome c oxidase cbb3-type subunit III
MSDHPPTPNEKLPGDPAVRPHSYDGIQEFDNKLPNWWLWTFYLAVIFTFLYWFIWYDSTLLVPDDVRVNAAIAQMDEVRLANMGEITNETLWEMARNPGFVEAGRAVYLGEGTCATCHGANLEGGVGVSLVDAEWTWGNQPLSVWATIAEGSPNKNSGMQAWMRQLGPQKINQVVAFILSHHDEAAMASATTLNPPIEPNL